MRKKFTKLLAVIVELALIEPDTLNEPVICEEPLTSKSPAITDAVTTPDICLLEIRFAIIYLLFFLLLKNHQQLYQ